jgi:hypothetical protein
MPTVPGNMAVLRYLAINAMQRKGSEGSVRGKFKRTGWDETSSTGS